MRECVCVCVRLHLLRPTAAEPRRPHRTQHPQRERLQRPLAARRAARTRRRAGSRAAPRPRHVGATHAQSREPRCCRRGDGESCSFIAQFQELASHVFSLTGSGTQFCCHVLQQRDPEFSEAVYKSREFYNLTMCEEEEETGNVLTDIIRAGECVCVRAVCACMESVRVCRSEWAVRCVCVMCVRVRIRRGACVEGCVCACVCLWRCAGGCMQCGGLRISVWNVVMKRVPCCRYTDRVTVSLH